MEVPYVAQGHVVKVPSKTLTSSVVFAGQSSPSGYLVIFYAPTVYANNSSRWSGFNFISGAGSNTNFNVGSLGGYTYANTYGGDFSTFSTNGFVWAGSLKVSIQAPQAVLAGTAFVGRLSYQ